MTIGSAAIAQWALSSMENDFISFGTNLSDFFIHCANIHNPIIYVHNLKYAGSFIINYLLQNEFQHVNTYEKVTSHTFMSLINDLGEYYNIHIYFYKNKKEVQKVELIDAHKILPFTLNEISDMFGLDLSILTTFPHNSQYELNKNIYILKKSLLILFEHGLTHSTLSSNALYDFIKSLGYNKYRHYFPEIPVLDKDLRQAYKGGWVYIYPKYINTTVGKGTVLDINSLYSKIMHDKKLPFGNPIYYKGKYSPDPSYPLYIQLIKCKFKLKNNHLPNLQIKNLPLFFNPTEWLTSSNGDEVFLTLTNIDLKLMFEQYDIDPESLEYISGWKFRACDFLFKPYIDKWIKVKIEGQKRHNKALRAISKLMLNSLSGKFGTNITARKKIPYLHNNVLTFKMEAPSNRTSVYLPVSIFITSYGRDFIIRSAQKIMDYSIKTYGENKFVYADTDSLHCLLSPEEVDKILDLDQTELGKWKIENEFKTARYIKQKCYIQKLSLDKLKVACAGLAKTEFKNITWENFKPNLQVNGKIRYHQVPGGVILEKGKYTIADKDILNNISKI